MQRLSASNEHIVYDLVGSIMKFLIMFEKLNESFTYDGEVDEQSEIIPARYLEILY